MLLLISANFTWSLERGGCCGSGIGIASSIESSPDSSSTSAGKELEMFRLRRTPVSSGTGGDGAASGEGGEGEREGEGEPVSSGGTGGGVKRSKRDFWASVGEGIFVLNHGRLMLV